MRHARAISRVVAVASLTTGCAATPHVDRVRTVAAAKPVTAVTSSASPLPSASVAATPPLVVPRPTLTLPTIRLPRLRHAATCVPTRPLGKPTRHWSVSDPGYDVRDVFVSGSRLWFGAAPTDVRRSTHLDGVDIDNGHTVRTPSTPWTEFDAADARFGWGIDLRHEIVVEYDLDAAKVARRLPAHALAGANTSAAQTSEPLSVTVADGVAYVLGWQKAGHDLIDSWLTAVDEATGAVRWTRDLHDGPGGWSWVPRVALAATADGVFVAYAHGGPPSMLVVRRFDTAGRLQAQRRTVVPGMQSDPPRLVVGPDGVYAMVWTPVGGWRDDTHRVIRLAPVDLSVMAVAPLYGGWDIQAGPSGVWATVPNACDDSYIARLEPRTLAPQNAYRLAPYQDDYIDASSTLLWVAEQSSTDGSPVDVNGYTPPSP